MPASLASIGSVSFAVAAVAVALIIVSIVLRRFGGKRARHTAEATRHDFGNATIEPLVVIDGGKVVDANRSFLRLSGYAGTDALPKSVAELFPGFGLSLPLLRRNDIISAECRLVGAAGDLFDVEVHPRFSRWHHAERLILAVHDISEDQPSQARKETPNNVAIERRRRA